MITNYHTHSVFCDGDNTPEEIVCAAIEQGFSAIGFSGHGYTDFDSSYCMQDTAGYIAEVKRLKEKYKNKIQVYLGVEEDAHCLVNRADFDYIIGSLHYTRKDGKRYPIDSDYECFKTCLELWNGDVLGFAEEYYSFFCDYILKRRPDIIGHFDLITKFDEMDTSLFFANDEYNRIAEKYIKIALQSGCIFEVNTGAISRGYRKTPYPNENLLRVIKNNGGRVILSSDSHSVNTLAFGFEQARTLLKDVGFKEIYTLSGNGFVKEYL
ncbi:MAG: histidinol-phosphatase [Clostridia bacterium]|nr:histidinol-phosphatase [Clostridia bacterium]